MGEGLTMYNSFDLTLKYLRYRLHAANGKGHGTHSPFIFQFIKNVLNDRQNYPEYEVVEKLRQQMLSNHSEISVEDFGAGSVTGNLKQRKISSIAHHAAKPKKYGQLLFRMCRNYKPANILELGTSLGITTSYLSLANPTAKLVTMEGASNIAKVANENFQNLGLKNIELVDGNFDNTLKNVLDKIPSVDFGFVDGNHRREPTERYFQQLLSKIHPDSILVFDDIHWSKEMEEAWEKIKLHPSVTCSVDLFFIGIVFFRKEFLEKLHFSIRF